jgi:kinetochore protein Nuf2
MRYVTIEMNHTIAYSTVQRTEKQLSNALSRLTRAQAHASDKKASSERTIERLQKEYNEMAIERRHNDKEVEELRSEADGVEIKMQEHLKESEKEINELLGVYWGLRRQTEVYMETLANKLNMKVSEG